MTSPRPGLNSQFPTLPDGRVVGSYKTYEAAKAAVDQLVETEGFSVQSISIVGSDLKSVERVTGRTSIGRAALNGVMTGVMIGLFMSLMWMIVNPITNIAVLLGVFLLSIAFGVIWSLIVYAMTPNKREFTSMMQLTAGSFDLIVAHEVSGEAARILQGSGGQRAWPQQQAGAQQGWPQQGGQQQWPGQQPGQAGQPGQPGAADAGARPEQQPGASAQSGSASEPTTPAAPAGPPKTYGEMQDELCRKEERGEA